MQDVRKVDIEDNINRRRDRRRKKNMTGYYILVVVLAGAIAFALSVTVLFNVNEVMINGVAGSRYTQEDIAASCGIKARDNLVRMNTQKIRNSMLDELVYVDDIQIKKQFPDKVVIEVTPSVDIAYVEYSGIGPPALVLSGSSVSYEECSGGYVIISEGWRITGYSEEPENKELMVIKGFRPVTTEEKTILNSKENEKNKALSEILSVIKSQGIEKIVAIDMTDNYDVVLDYDNRIKIKIEKPSDVEYKLKYAYKIITEELRENKSGYLIYRNQLGYSYVSKEEYDRINGNVSSSFSPDGEIKTTTSAVPEDTALGTPVTEVTGTVSETAVSEVSVPSV